MLQASVFRFRQPASGGRMCQETDLSCTKYSNRNSRAGRLDQPRAADHSRRPGWFERGRRRCRGGCPCLRQSWRDDRSRCCRGRAVSVDAHGRQPGQVQGRYIEDTLKCILYAFSQYIELAIEIAPPHTLTSELLLGNNSTSQMAQVVNTLFTRYVCGYVL